ncbi:MAG: glycoside hydrolase family 3 protein, partial [Erysipelotrichaceae bacterium]|nr:glycoside hydrolase family 3 protein [Erysipelotrichaceae bacterium]
MMEIKEMIAGMSLEEKIKLCAGIDFWQTRAYDEYGIPSFFMCDGPSGLRKQEKGADMLGINDSRPATCFPAAVSTANTWDEELLYRMGEAIGEEARDQRVGVVLGPGINIKRNPLCGRNFEYFSEDPLETGVLASAFVKGLQSQGIGCSLKHFACNSQEKDRMSSDSIIDERALREIYLRAFEIVVKEASPATVMSAYPKINGIHCSDNRKLLNDILREEWGFEGMVMTDWGGMNDRIEAFKAGNDLMMPGGSDYMEKDVIEAVKEGRLDEKDIDRCCERIIRTAMKAAETLRKECRTDYHKHHELAVEVAEKGAVLLKNDRDLLPLKEDGRILICGSMAKRSRYQGSGSSHVNPLEMEEPIDFLQRYEYVQGCDEHGDTNEELLKELSDKARTAETVIIFAGLPGHYESEGFDREDMKMPEGHVRMIETAAQVNSNTAVVLMCGSPVECDWADRVSSILYMGLSGEGTGRACYDLLFGKTVPCGKLSESWPYRYEDVPSSSYYARSRDALYMESIYVGYRYYDKAGIEVRWPYGYGLSYTDFRFSDLETEGNRVSLKVTNTGTRSGSETVQLYIGQKDPKLHRPQKELRHFLKIGLKPKETREVVFKLDDDDFKLWDNGFRKIKGDYLVCIGNSSRDIFLKETVSIDGEDPVVPSWQKGSWYEDLKGKISLQQWERMMGRRYESHKTVKGQFTVENTVEEM